MSNIIRSKRDHNFTILDNTGPRDPRLSWGAKGLLTYMLTMPDDWEFHDKELRKHADDTVYKLRKYLAELKEMKYLAKHPLRDDATKKIIKWVTMVHETPQASPESQTTEIRNLDKSPDDRISETGENQMTAYREQEGGHLLSEKPESGETSHLENQTSGNRTLLITDLPNTDQPKKHIPVGDEASPPPTPEGAGKLPEILRPTGLLFIAQTGKKDIGEDDALCLRLLARLHTPAAIQKQILVAVDRIKKKGSVKLETPDGDPIEITELRDLPIRYVYNSMKNYSTLRGAGSGGGVPKSSGSRGASGRENKDYTKGSEEFFTRGG